MKIAVIGSGISGLACAYHLAQRHNVTLFESEPRLGGHAHTVEVDIRGATHAVDTGFIVYNEKTYPDFTRLLAELGVVTRPAEMSFGMACERTGLEWSSRGLRGLFATPRIALRPPFLRMVSEILRFAREAPGLASDYDTKSTLRELVNERGYSAEFRDGYLVPMGAAIWSAGTEDLLEMPAASFTRFFENHGLLGRGGGVQWRTIVGGSRIYVDALARRFRGRVALSTPVFGVTPTPRGVEVRTAEGAAPFDRAVLAVHADTALSLLTTPTLAERRVLGAIRYSRNETILHTDASLLPRRPAARASWNSIVPSAPSERALVTYDLSRLQSIRSAEPLLVTLNGTSRIAPDRILARFDYDHPILDAGAIDAQREHTQIDGDGGIHFCGAYWRWGFHEDGLQSAMRVVRAIEANV